MVKDWQLGMREIQSWAFLNPEERVLEGVKANSQIIANGICVTTGPEFSM